MKRIPKKDFNISIRGLDILQTFMYINISLIVLLVIVASIFGITQLNNLGSVIVTILIGFVIALPSIIVCCLIQMFIDYMYNVQEQTKTQSNLDITSRKILEEIQIMNSYKMEQNN